MGRGVNVPAHSDMTYQFHIDKTGWGMLTQEECDADEIDTSALEDFGAGEWFDHILYDQEYDDVWEVIKDALPKSFERYPRHGRNRYWRTYGAYEGEAVIAENRLVEVTAHDDDVYYSILIRPLMGDECDYLNLAMTHVARIAKRVFEALAHYGYDLNVAKGGWGTRKALAFQDGM